jgi:hypothetical protein
MRYRSLNAMIVNRRGPSARLRKPQANPMTTFSAPTSSCSARASPDRPDRTAWRPVAGQVAMTPSTVAW